MSVFKTIPAPSWALVLPQFDTAEKSRVALLIRLAAIYHNERGSIGELSVACGFKAARIYMAARRGIVSGEIAVAIEGVLGREWFPRELFRPDLFTLPQE